MTEPVVCPVVACRKAGDTPVVLRGIWTLHCCPEHAADVEADPELWRVADGDDRSGLRIVKAGSGVPVDHRPAKRPA